ncbi:hypothetical protein ABW19_dt0209681 [Dactylella cylindrospora]|nr:hypothetical protein ABW19_dt0209681 [Dactylella cylindrospora]
MATRTDTALHFFLEIESTGEQRLYISHLSSLQIPFQFTYQNYFYQSRNETQSYRINVTIEVAPLVPAAALPTSTPRGMQMPNDHTSTTANQPIQQSLNSVNSWLAETPGPANIYAIGGQFESPEADAARDLAMREDMLRELDDIMQGNIGQQAVGE